MKDRISQLEKTVEELSLLTQKLSGLAAEFRRILAAYGKQSKHGEPSNVQTVTSGPPVTADQKCPVCGRRLLVATDNGFRCLACSKIITVFAANGKHIPPELPPTNPAKAISQPTVQARRIESSAAECSWEQPANPGADEGSKSDDFDYWRDIECEGDSQRGY